MMMMGTTPPLPPDLAAMLPPTDPTMPPLPGDPALGGMPPLPGDPLSDPLAGTMPPAPPPPNPVSPDTIRRYVDQNGILGPAHAAKLALDAYNNNETALTEFFGKIATDFAFAKALAAADGENTTISWQDLARLAQGKDFIARDDVGRTPPITGEFLNELSVYARLQPNQSGNAWDPYNQQPPPMNNGGMWPPSQGGGGFMDPGQGGVFGPQPQPGGGQFMQPQPGFFMPPNMGGGGVSLGPVFHFGGNMPANMMPQFSGMGGQTAMSNSTPVMGPIGGGMGMMPMMQQPGMPQFGNMGGQMAMTTGSPMLSPIGGGMMDPFGNMGGQQMGGAMMMPASNGFPMMDMSGSGMMMQPQMQQGFPQMTQGNMTMPSIFSPSNGGVFQPTMQPQFMQPQQNMFSMMPQQPQFQQAPPMMQQPNMGMPMQMPNNIYNVTNFTTLHNYGNSGNFPQRTPMMSNASSAGAMIGLPQNGGGMGSPMGMRMTVNFGPTFAM